MESIMIQGLGLIAAALMIASFLCRGNRRLFALQIGSYAAFIVHILLLGGVTGALTQTVSLLRNVVLYQAATAAWAQRRGWLPLFLAAYVAVAALTWQDIFSIFPCIAMCAITLASWTGKGRNIRLCVLTVNSPAWIIYDIYTGSVAGVIQEIFCMAASAWALLRYGRRLDGEAEGS